MALAGTNKDRLMGAALVDIGPDVAPAGLEAIKNYIGRNPGAETFEEAKEVLHSGTQYFFDVLQGGINRAQQLVVQKTRFHGGDRLVRPLGKDQEMKATPVEQRIERGQVLCGTPEMVVDQIRTMHRALDHGHMNLIVKVGNMPDDFVRASMTLLKDRVFPEVKDLVPDAIGMVGKGVAAE